MLCLLPALCRYAYDLRPVGAAGLPDAHFSAQYQLYIIQEFCDAGSLAQAIDSGRFVDQTTHDRNLVRGSQALLTRMMLQAQAVC